MKPIGQIAKRIYIVLSIMIATMLFAAMLLGSDNSRSEASRHIRAFSEGWTQDPRTDYLIDNLKSGSFPTDRGLHKTLPDDLNDTDALCFSSQNANLEVTIGDREVYSFESRENLTGMGYGSKVHTVELCREDSGKTVTFCYRGINDSFDGGRIYEVCLAPSVDFFRYKISEMGVAVFFSVLTIFFGLVLVLIHLSITDKEALPFNIMGLGAFALVMGVWLLIDTNFLQLLTGTVYVWRDIRLTILFFAGYPLVSFLNSMTRLKRGIYLHISFFLSIGGLAVLLLLRYAAGIDMHISHSKIMIVFVALMLLLIVIMLTENSRYTRMLGTKSSFRAFYIGVTVLLACGAGDIIIYLVQPAKRDTFGGLTRIAMTLFMVIMLIRFMTWWTRDHKEVERDRFINRALQYAVSSESPENNIRSLIRYLGTEFEARRIFIFEDQKNDKYRGTYEWFAEGQESLSLELMYVPFHGLIDDLYGAFKKNDQKLIVRNIEDYRNANPAFYNVLSTNHVDNMVLAALEVNQNLIGVVGVVGAPEKSLEGVAEIISLISYFLAQLILQREEQKRMYYYTYNDALSGAMNHRAYLKFIEQGLDTTTAFGYFCCSVTGLEEINKTYGYEAGDRIVVEVAGCLMEVFGNENVYRLNGTDFSVFGFESEELFFENDVERVKKRIAEKQIEIRSDSLYCMYGTKNLDLVIRRVNDRMSEGS